MSDGYYYDVESCRLIPILIGNEQNHRRNQSKFILVTCIAILTLLLISTNIFQTKHCHHHTHTRQLLGLLGYTAKHVSSDAKEIIQRYTGKELPTNSKPGYLSTNRALRNAQGVITNIHVITIRQYAEDLRSALIAVNYAGYYSYATTVYRFQKMSQEQLQNILNKKEEKLPYNFYSFVSTTISKNTALEIMCDWHVRLMIDAPGLSINVIFELQILRETNADISSFSINKHEKELVLLNDIDFEILDIDTEDKTEASFAYRTPKTQVIKKRTFKYRTIKLRQIRNGKIPTQQEVYRAQEKWHAVQGWRESLREYTGANAMYSKMQDHIYKIPSHIESRDKNI